MKRSVELFITGIVQGVGFRPFVYREAKKHLVCGWVLNAQDGVHVRAEGEENLVDSFIMSLSDNAPSASNVEQISIKDVPLENFEDFEIVFSDEDTQSTRTLISPDLATCNDCARELFDESDRRFRYPFINCTNCGPRYTIIEDLPYDRDKTSMAHFVMCEDCDREYHDPADRRFHAQPDACFECGPHIIYNDFSGTALVGSTRELSDEILSKTIDALLEGKIIAIKGLGGFHLCCDANNRQALSNLRERKHRDNKAFAVMMEDVRDIEKLCHLSEQEEDLLKSPEHPIVLLKKQDKSLFHDELSSDLPELGVMLPYTPLQMLLLHDFKEAFDSRSHSDTTPAMLVMTSGNLHDEPIVIDDEEALSKFRGIADIVVGNDRAILTRFDDSVARVLQFGDDESAIQMIRRSRGYAPRPIALPKSLEGDKLTLAVGPEQKNTFSYVKDNKVFVSQHIGDVETSEVESAWFEAKNRLEKLLGAKDNCDIARDKHPEYITSKWAFDHVASAKENFKLFDVQHHHAHIASALAENDLEGPAIGFAFDGTGFGEDGTIWGGEVLIANLESFERFANFAYTPLIGGSVAIKEPLRMAFSLLYSNDLLDSDLASSFLDRLGSETCELYSSMINDGINTTYTSSLGRIFDGVSALIGVCEHPTYEGESAIELEAAIDMSDTSYIFDDRYTIGVVKNSATEHSTAKDTSVLVLDTAKVVHAILEDMDSNVSQSTIARRFHDAICNCVLTISRFANSLYGISKVVLSGGVWMNRYLTQRCVSVLQASGFDVVLNKELPANDGCISYGQAVIKCALDEASKKGE